MEKVMYYIDKTQSRSCDFQEQTMKAQRMKMARERLTAEFVELLAKSPEDGVRWKGTVTDLVEVAHIAYMQGTVCGIQGSACTFRELVARVCSVLHVKMPHNPQACAYQAAQRKGVRCSPYIERYARKMMMAGLTPEGQSQALHKGRVSDDMTCNHSILMSDIGQDAH